MTKHDFPCLAPFRQPIIRVDGTLTVCNYDLRLENSLGNVSSGFSRLWYSDYADQIRIAHITGENLPEKCRNCTPDHFLPRNQALRFLQIVEKEHLAWSFLRRTGEKLRILLINPRVSEKAPYKMTVTLGLGYLAAYLRPFYHVEILNLPFSGFTDDDAVNYAEKNNFNIVGITGMTYQARNALRLARLLKAADYTRKIIFGGPFATLAYEEVLAERAVDAVVLGEGEATLLALVRELEKSSPDISTVSGIAFVENGKIRLTPQRDLLDINTLPFPARDLMPSHGFIPDDRAFSDDQKGEISIMAMFSRGCPGRCIFCATPTMWRRKVRFRSLDLIIAEIKEIIRLFGVRNIVIDDDAFTAHKDKVREFCRRIISEKIEIRWRCNTKVTLVDKELFLLMKQAGCIKVTYGVESGNDDILSLIGKDFRVADVKRALELNRLTGLPGTMLMIVGHPYETQKSALDSMNLVKELKPEGGWDFQILQPHPGTPLRDKFARETGKILSDDWDDYFSDNITYIPDGFTPEEFLELCRKATGRPVKYAGHDFTLQKNYEIQNRFYIEIPPQHWEYGFFNEWPLFYWDGDETCKEGYTHTLGKNHGEINYLFDVPLQLDNIRKARVTARLSSQESGKVSTVTLYINQKPAGDRTVSGKNLCGEEYSWDFTPDFLKKEKNELKLRVSAGKDDHGISIFYRPVSGKGEETPIRVTLELYSPAAMINSSGKTENQPALFKPVPLLILDTATFCDLSCIMCPIGYAPESKPKKIMPWPLMEKILVELTSTDFKLADAVLPFWNGEPLVYPYFKDMLSFLIRSRRKSFNCMVLHTNCQRLDSETADLIIRSNLFGAVTFSLDASSPETYSKIRVGGSLETAERNIIGLIEQRLKSGHLLPTITLQFLVMPENHREASSFIARWQEIFLLSGLPSPAIVFDDFMPVTTDAIFIKRTTARSTEDQHDYDELHRKTLIELGLIADSVEKPVTTDEFIPQNNTVVERRPCVGLFENLGIRFDGSVSACCRDFDGRNQIGSVWDKSIYEIWESAELRQQRLWHINRQFDRLPLCQKCSNQPNHRISDEEIRKFLEYCNENRL